MPDEPAVLEAPVVTEAPAETPEPVAAPEPAVSPEGETPAVTEPEPFDFKALKGKTDPTEVRALIDLLTEDYSDEQKSEVYGEWEKRGEQRVQTRTREMSEAQDSRHTLWQQAATIGKQAEGYLLSQITAAKQGALDAFADPATVEQAAVHFRNGAIAQLALENEQAITPVRDQYLPEPTAEEQKALEPYIYDDARKGTFTQLPKLFELAVARAKAEGVAEGLKQVEKKLQAAETLMTKVQAIQAVKNGTAPAVTGGVAVAAGLTPESYAAMTPGEQRRLQKDDPKAIDRMFAEHVRIPERV